MGGGNGSHTSAFREPVTIKPDGTAGTYGIDHSAMIPYLGWEEHQQYDDYWTAEDTTPHIPKMDVPCCTIGSWFDFMCQVTTACCCCCRRFSLRLVEHSDGAVCCRGAWRASWGVSTSGRRAAAASSSSSSGPGSTAVPDTQRELRALQKKKFPTPLEN